MDMILLVLETKIADVGKLISLRNLLVRKAMCLVLTTTSTTLILTCTFGTNCMTRIAYIYSCLPRTHSFHFDLQSQHSLSLSHFALQRQHSLSYILTSSSQPHENVYILQPCSAFSVRLLQPRTQPQKFYQTPKVTNNQHGKRHMPPRIHGCIFVCWYLSWNT